MFEKIALDASTHSGFATHSTQAAEKSVEEQGNVRRNFSAIRTSATDLNDSVKRAT